MVPIRDFYNDYCHHKHLLLIGTAKTWRDFFLEKRSIVCINHENIVKTEKDTVLVNLLQQQ